MEIKGEILAVDVDDTLVYWCNPPEGAPVKEVEWKGYVYQYNPKVHLQITRHIARGHTVMIWSAGGQEWAQKVASMLGLKSNVITMSKPKWAIDDLPNPLAQTRIYHPDDIKE